MRIDSARHVRSAYGLADFPKDRLPEIAFAGRSNVGKSSLLNRLLGRKKLARISSTPGRTRAVNFFLVNSRIYFVDLPGYGYAKVGKKERRFWAELMDVYLRQATGRAQIVQLVDAKVGATDLDRQANAYLRSVAFEPIIVATRADRVPKGRRKAAVDAIRRALAPEDGCPVIAASARTGEGVREIWREIDRFLAAAGPGNNEGVRA